MLNIDVQGSKTTLTLNRPDVRNAFNDDLISQLTSAFETLDPTTRVVVLQGEGKSFCAGGDLEWMKKAATYTEEENFADAMKLAGLFQAIVDSPALVIGRIHGSAFGGGCGLVAACDVAVVEENTLFSFSEVKLGLVPATISSFVIPKIGSGNSRWLFATGEPFDASIALRIGLVHEVTNIVDLDAAIDRKVANVLKAGPQAVAMAKKLAVEGPYPMDAASRLLAKARASEEGKEGVQAFLEKRPAAFVSME